MVTRIRGYVYSEERGVALVVVLLFAVLLMMLVATMLAVGGTQVSISGTQRNSAQALEHAQAGVEEGIRRVEANRSYSNPDPWGSSVDPTGVQVRIVPRRAGPNGQIIEIQADATVGVARRRLSVLALAVSKLIPPKIMYGHNFSQQGNAADVGSGDVYAQTYIEFVQVPDAAGQYSYSGWGIRKKAPLDGYRDAPCYTHAQCVSLNPSKPDAARWYPGQRRSVYESLPLNSDITGSTDTRVPQAVLNYTCPAGPPPAQAVQTILSNGPGYTALDQRADMVPGPANAAATGGTALYGCTADNLPYTWVREEFSAPQEFVAPWNPSCTTAMCTVAMWFQVISFERWFNTYWTFNEPTLEFQKANGLDTDPARGAIPPFPPFGVLEGNPDTTVVGGGTINNGSGINMGTCANPNSCSSPSSDRQTVLLDCVPSGSCTYTVNGTLDGHGVLLVDGDLVVNGTFNYWGTVVVNGNLTLGAGNVTVYGGIVAKSTAWLTGSIRVYAGTNVSNLLIGPATVTARSWRER
jgi:hypothetical protein